MVPAEYWCPYGTLHKLWIIFFQKTFILKSMMFENKKVYDSTSRISPNFFIIFYYYYFCFAVTRNSHSSQPEYTQD